MDNKSLLPFFAVFAIVVGVIFIAPHVSPSRTTGGLPFPSAVTSASTTITTATTSIYTSTAGLQYIKIQNLSTSTFFCAFGQGVNATLNTGPVIFPTTSSTGNTFETSDPALLGKPMNCLGTGSGNVGVLKY